MTSTCGIELVYRFLHQLECPWSLMLWVMPGTSAYDSDSMGGNDWYNAEDMALMHIAH